MTTPISRTLLIAFVLACTLAGPAWAAPTLGSVTEAAGNAAGSADRGSATSGGGSNSAGKSSGASNTSGGGSSVKDTVARTTVSAGDGAGTAVGHTADDGGASTGDAVEAVRDTAGDASALSGDAVTKAVGETVGDSAASIGDDVASTRNTIDTAVRDVAGDTGTRTIGDAGPDTQNLIQVVQTTSENGIAVPLPGDPGAPSPGSLGIPSSSVAEMGALDEAAAGAGVPAAAADLSRESAPVPARAPASTLGAESLLRSSGRDSGAQNEPVRNASPAAPIVAPANAPATSVATASVSTPVTAGSHEPAAARSRDAHSTAIAGGLDLRLLAATSSRAGLLAAGSSQGAGAGGSAVRQNAPSAPPVGASGIAAGISAAGSSTLLLVLASVLALWLAGPSFRLRSRIVAGRPVPFISLLERPG